MRKQSWEKIDDNKKNNSEFSVDVGARDSTQNLCESNGWMQVSWLIDFR